MILRLSIVFSLFIAASEADKPCAGLLKNNESVVCVCNNTYCDDVIRDQPEKGRYILYVSSKSGQRFKKSIGYMKNRAHTSSTGHNVNIKIRAGIRYQTIIGFGGAVTDAAAINWKSMSEELQQKLIDSYFGPSGLEYNTIRVPIGGCDFSTHAYAYNEYPKDDVHLSNFSLALEDYQYKIPMIKSAMQVSPSPINVLGTTWSPPPWMKTNDAFYGVSALKKEYYQTYADYHLKFLQKYNESGIALWGITTTNEPINGIIPLARFNSLGWKPEAMAKWICNNLGPTIRNSTFKDLKILTMDDQRYSLAFWLNQVINDKPEVLRWIDGIAVHFYADPIIPASLLTTAHKKYPDKFIMGTEACEGSLPWKKNVVIGSWDRAKDYIHDIIEDLNHWVSGWIDWNICLNPNGGPNWANNFVDSPILVYSEQDYFIKQPMFYALGHFSKFLPRDSQRINAKLISGSNVEYVAFVTTRNTIVVVIYNGCCNDQTINLKFRTKSVVFHLESESVATVEWDKDSWKIPNDSSKTLDISSEMLDDSSKTLDISSEMLDDSSKTLDISSEMLDDSSKTLDISSKMLDDSSEMLENSSNKQNNSLKRSNDS